MSTVVGSISDSSPPDSRRDGRWRSHVAEMFDSAELKALNGSISSAGVRHVSGSLVPRASRGHKPAKPSGLRCCGSSPCSSQLGSWLNSPPAWIGRSSLTSRKGFNEVATGSAGESLIAFTGCPSTAPVGLSSEGWARLGWPYGITYTLLASDSKRSTDNVFSTVAILGHAPTACEAEFLQGFERGALHALPPETP